MGNRSANDDRSFDFWQGQGIHEDPTAAGCLECLLSDATDLDFSDWCSDLGFSEDSREAERLYRACVKVGKSMRRLLGDDYGAFERAER